MCFPKLFLTVGVSWLLRPALSWHRQQKQGPRNPLITSRAEEYKINQRGPYENPATNREPHTDKVAVQGIQCGNEAKLMSAWGNLRHSRALYMVVTRSPNNLCSCAGHRGADMYSVAENIRCSIAQISPTRPGNKFVYTHPQTRHLLTHSFTHTRALTLFHPVFLTPLQPLPL